MRKNILQLQEKSSGLEPGRQTRKEFEKKAVDICDRFFESVDEQPAYRVFDESVNDVLDASIPAEPEQSQQVFNDFEQNILPPGLNPASGKHFGYIPGGGLMTSAVGDYIAAATNRYAGVYFSSPGAVLMETRLINWMASLVGYGKRAGGYLSSGGSIANLSAVVTARDNAGLESGRFSKAVVYLSSQTHHCVERALNIAGLGDAVRRFIRLDEKYRMISADLEKQIREDREKGLIPWMIVASAGSTDTGAVDPLNDIAGIADRENLWYHVDAAYGGFFLLAENGRQKLAGIEHADSVVLDPHKGMFLPYGVGALVVKDIEKLAKAHAYSANYMKDTEVYSQIYSPADLSPELSKHFRALRMWLPLKLHGVNAFKHALEEKIYLSQYAWQKLDEMDDIETGPKPQLSVFMFRWKPKRGSADELNKLLHQAIVEDGEVFLSTTRIKGKFVLRMAILSVRTHLADVDRFLEIVREKIEELKSKKL